MQIKSKNSVSSHHLIIASLPAVGVTNTAFAFGVRQRLDSNHTKENTNRNETQQAGARHYHVLRPKVMPKIENLRPFFWVPVSSFSALLA